MIFPTSYHLSHENLSPNILELPNSRFSLTSSKPQLNQNIKHSVTNPNHNTLPFHFPVKRRNTTVRPNTELRQSH